MATAWGIDIGRRSIKGVKLRDSATGPVLEVADAVDVEIKPKATDAEKDEAMRSALAKFLSRHGIRNDMVFLSIPGHTTFNRVLRVPVVDDKKLESTIRFEAQQQIPFPIEEVVWDYHPLPVVTPGEMEISLYAVKNEFIRKFLHNVELAGLIPAGIQIAPLALFNFSRYELEMRGANLILDTGSDATDLLVIDQDKTWMRTIPIAGNDVTSALEKKFQLPFDEAEKLKIKSGSSKQAQKIFSVMKPVLKDIFSEVDRSLSYYRSQVPDVEFKECLLLGSGSKIVGLRKFAKEALEIDTTRVTSLSKITVGTKVNLEFLQANLQGLAVALGLALQAIERSDNRVNFLPRHLIELRQTRAKRPWYAAAAVIFVVAALVAWAGLSGYRAEYVQAMEHSQVLEKFQGLSRQLEGLKDDQGTRAWIADRAELGAGRDAVARAYKEAMDVVFPAQPGENRPAIWVISVDIKPAEGAGPHGPFQVELLGAFENPEHEKMAADMAALGENPDKKAVSDLQAKFAEELEADVQSLLIKPLAALGRGSAEHMKGTFVQDLSPDVHFGTRFYRFLITWQHPGEE